MKKLLLKIGFIAYTSLSVYASGGGDILRASMLIDTLEYKLNESKDIGWDAYMYVGYDTGKIYIYSEGEKNGKTSEIDSENQIVYSHAISPYWDIQAGFGYDKAEDNSNSWGLISIMGMAPYFFETKTSILADSNKNIALRTSAEYEALFTQKLILSSSINLSAYTKENKDMGLNKGLSNFGLATRLRYEFKREFAPYIGVEWSKNFASNDSTIYMLAGIRAWF